MNEKGTFIAALIDASLHAYAAGTIVRLQERSDSGAEPSTEQGFGDLVSNVEEHLVQLAAALACGRPEVFALNLAWVRETFVARGKTLDGLRARIECLLEELAENLPENAASMACGYVRPALEGFSSPTSPPPGALDRGTAHGELASRFLRAILRGDHDGAQELVLGAHEQGTSPADLRLRVIAPALSEVGRLWQVRELHVAGEHLSSRIVEDVLAVLRAAISRKATNGHSVVVAASPGSRHDIGARIVADQFHDEGWRVLFLGADTPAEDLAEAACEHRPDLVALSLGLAPEIRGVAQSIRALKTAIPALPVLLGGRLPSQVPELWRDVGADAGAPDAASATEIGAALVEQR